MPIYTDLMLSWPQCLQVFQQARLYPGRWFNYNIYRISRVNPLQIHSYSPINLLEENRGYHYYKIFEGCSPVHCDNVTWKYIVNKEGMPLQLYLPEHMLPGDIIVVSADDNHDELVQISSQLR